MLTIAETSGLIAAVVVIVQYVLPAATAVVLVRCAGNESTAVTWSVLNRYISNTIWPHLLRADAVSGRHVSTSTTVLTWTSTVGAALLVLASVLTPLGLSEKILPGDHQLVEFQYVKDPGPWGTVTMPRPNFKFSRYCEVGLRINCPGQYQGIYMNETEPGKWRSVETDENSTINITIPRNYTEMFRSATSDQGNTVSGMFDMQYRRWAIDRTDIIERGQPYVRGKSRHIENLLVEDQILLKEGLIIDMRTNPGIGFRNHSIPLNLRYGGVWTEDLTWIEPITQCADTNISAEMRTETNVEDFGANVTLRMIDRGAFSGLQYSDLESRIWIDNQTLDLFAHAHKAARMHNVLVASSLDISLPLNDTTQTIPPRPIGTDVVSSTDFGSMKTSSLKGLGGTTPHVPGYDSDNSTSGNSSSQTSLYIPRYSDGMKKLLALNYTAIEQICEGHYEVATSSLDLRAGSINNTAIKCGAVFGAPADGTVESLSASTFTGVQMARKNLYVCATAYKASIKTVHFRHNGTSEDFAGLEVIDIVAKTYSSEISKPLWAVENSGDRRMGFDPLWGITSDAFEDTEGFDTLRSESLWLPTSPSMTDGIGQTEGGDALAAAGGFLLRLANLYEPWIDSPDFSGAMEFALQERWSRLSQNHTTVSSIPSLILTNGLAAGLVGTKTSFSSRYVEWPASLAVENSTRGLPRAKVQVYRRVIQYDIRYAIPSFLILGLVLASVVAAVWSAITSSSIVCTMQRLYNQTSAGRLAVTLLQPDQSDPTQSSHAWVAKEGSLRIAFGMISQSEDDNFCRIVQNGESGSEMPPETVTEAAKTERGHLLPGTAQ